MEDYKKVYHKLFNTMTDLTQEAKELISRMEAAQQQCEDMVIDFEDDEAKEDGAG